MEYTHYECPICHLVLERDLSAFLSHARIHVLAALRREGTEADEEESWAGILTAKENEK